MNKKQLIKLSIGDFIVTAIIVLGSTLVAATIGTTCWNQLASTYSWPRAGYFDVLAACWLIYGISFLVRLGFYGVENM